MDRANYYEGPISEINAKLDVIILRLDEYERRLQKAEQHLEDAWKRVDEILVMKGDSGS